MEFIFANPDDALTIVMKFAPGENRAHQQFMLQAEMDDAVSDLTRENGLGWMTGRQWKNLYDQLLEFEAPHQPLRLPDRVHRPISESRLRQRRVEIAAPSATVGAHGRALPTLQELGLVDELLQRDRRL